MLKRLGIFAGDAGFTLIEMLVTVTIIGVLAAVVTVGVSGASSTAQTQANKQLYASIQAGIDAYAASTPAAKGAETGVAFGTSAFTTGWYQADGSTYTPLAGDYFVNLVSGNNQFSSFFRLPTPGWTIATATTNGTGSQCLVGSQTTATAGTFTLKACHN